MNAIRIMVVFLLTPTILPAQSVEVSATPVVGLGHGPAGAVMMGVRAEFLTVATYSAYLEYSRWKNSKGCEDQDLSRRRCSASGRSFEVGVRKRVIDLDQADVSVGVSLGRYGRDSPENGSPTGGLDTRLQVPLIGSLEGVIGGRFQYVFDGDFRSTAGESLSYLVAQVGLRIALW